MDLNADLGESYGPWKLGDDEALAAQITSANLACGFHAGDFNVMEASVALCARAGVAVGAQPGYPDLAGFGRRPMPFTPEEVESLVRYQIGALEGFCRAHGVGMRHVKPHGALYNLAARDAGLANAIARSVSRFSVDLMLFGLASSEPMRSAAADHGLRYVPEAFADRRYLPDGSLQPRSEPGSVVADPAAAAAQALQIALKGTVTAADGTTVRIAAESICCHGDTPRAAEIAAAVRSSLSGAGVALAAP
jgi:UPF0271 protein